jgi:carbon storage regulator
MYDPPEALPNSVPTLWLPFGAGAGIWPREARRQAKEGSMLVLSRKTNQSIMIGDAIRVIVVGFDGDQVKLGIEAPRDVPVHRFEIFAEIRKGRSPGGAAAGLGDGDTLRSP